MKTKRLLSALLVLAMLISTFIIPAMADDTIKVLLNGTELTFDVPPQLINGRTMVPMRKIFEAMGAEVEWDNDTQTVTATKDDIVIIMQINNLVISISGKEIVLDVPPRLVDGRTLVPVRAVAEGLGADVKWEGETKKVFITKEAVPPNKFILTDELRERGIKTNVLVECTNNKENTKSHGSGVIISQDGLIVTSFHVIDNKDSIKITTSEEKSYSDVRIVGYVKSLDLAVLKITENGLSFAHIATDFNIKESEDIYTIGNPKDKVNVITQGVVYNTDTMYFGYTMIQCIIEADHGSSGGGVYNTNGELVGILRFGTKRLDGTIVSGYVPINYLNEVQNQKKNLSVAEFKKELSKTIDISEHISSLQKLYTNKDFGFTIEHVFTTPETKNSSEKLPIFFTFGDEQYTKLIKAMDSGIITKKKIEEFMYEIYTSTVDTFPDKSVKIYFSLADDYKEEPTIFTQAGWGRYNPESKKWTVIFPLCIMGTDASGNDFNIQWLLN